MAKEECLVHMQPHEPKVVVGEAVDTMTREIYENWLESSQRSALPKQQSENARSDARQQTSGKTQPATISIGVPAGAGTMPVVDQILWMSSDIIKEEGSSLLLRFHWSGVEEWIQLHDGWHLSFDALGSPGLQQRMLSVVA